MWGEQPLWRWVSNWLQQNVKPDHKRPTSEIPNLGHHSRKEGGKLYLLSLCWCEVGKSPYRAEPETLETREAKRSEGWVRGIWYNTTASAFCAFLLIFIVTLQVGAVLLSPFGKETSGMNILVWLQVQWHPTPIWSLTFLISVTCGQTRFYRRRVTTVQLFWESKHIHIVITIYCYNCILLVVIIVNFLVHNL
jgi:hypothetical protein